jgi:hypothetical protein
MSMPAEETVVTCSPVTASKTGAPGPVGSTQEPLT